MRTGRELCRLEVRDWRRDPAFSPDGSLIATMGVESAFAFWEVKPAAGSRPPLGNSRRMAGIALTAGGRQLAVSAADGSLTLYDPDSGRPLRSLERDLGSCWPLVPSPDGKWLAGQPSGFPRLWDVASGKILSVTQRSKSLYSIAFSPDGEWLALGSVDGTVHLQDTATSENFRSVERDDSRSTYRHVVWSPAGVIAASQDDHAVTLFDPAGGWVGLRHEGAAFRGTILTYSPDGRLLAAAGDDGRAHLFEVISGQHVGQTGDRPFPIHALAFSADGRTLALGGGERSAAAPGPESARDYAIRLWDREGTKSLRPLGGHQGLVNSLAFTPDGRTLVSGSADTTVIAWDVAAVTGRLRPEPLDLSAERLEALWAELAGDDGARAQRAVAELVRSPRTAAFLGKALPAAGVTAERLAALIADLDHDEFERRERASRELTELRELSKLAIRKALEARPAPEARRRLRQVLEAINGKVPSPSWLRSVRAIQVLEGIGTPEARRILQGLAKGAPEARLTQEAKASLERLERRSRLRP
jgi:WD40 repeat protein